MTSQEVEKSKVFNRLAQLVGFYPPVLKKSHRGILARMAMPVLEAFENAEFEKNLKPLCNRAPIPVYDGGKLVQFLNV